MRGGTQRATLLVVSILGSILLLAAANAKPFRMVDTELEPAEFSSLDRWADDDHAASFATFRKSCAAILKRRPPFRPFEEDLRGVCERAVKISLPVNEPTARAFFEENFRPVRISRLGERDGFLTGYYEPEVEGRRIRGGGFEYPMYRRPADLAAKASQMKRSKRHRVGKRVVGYFDRAAIEEGALAGRNLEICWLKDPIESFFIHIQGSARIRLEDGKLLRLNFDSHNGFPYISVGRVLIDRGVIPREEMSMDAIRTYFSEMPDEAREIMRTNKSYVFFREISELPADIEPPGAQGVNLTRERSVAIDKNLHIYGTPFWIEADLPLEGEKSATKFHRLMIGQDTGGAILGPARADIYFGAGLNAGMVAGRIRHPGRFYILVPRSADPSKLIDPAPLPRSRPKT